MRLIVVRNMASVYDLITEGQGPLNQSRGLCNNGISCHQCTIYSILPSIQSENLVYYLFHPAMYISTGPLSTVVIGRAVAVMARIEKISPP